MEKKSKAPIIIAVCAVVLIAAVVMLIVTKGFQTGRTDPNKARFERELGEKYGEEFVCLNIETHGIAIDPPVMMDAVCAPARDPSLSFNARIVLDLNSTENTDDYPYMLARRQITEEFSDKISGIWDGFTAFCTPGFLIENDDIVGKIKERTFDWRYYARQLHFMDDAEYARFQVMIIVDSSSDNGSYKEEWNALQKIIEECLAECRQTDTDLVIDFALYFPPSALYAECAEIVRNISVDWYDRYCMLEEKLGNERIILFGLDPYIVEEVGYKRLAEFYVEAREEMG